jgi:hypothetical protein
MGEGEGEGEIFCNQVEMRAGLGGEEGQSEERGRETLWAGGVSLGGLGRPSARTPAAFGVEFGVVVVLCDGRVTRPRSCASPTEPDPDSQAIAGGVPDWSCPG